MWVEHSYYRKCYQGELLKADVFNKYSKEAQRYVIYITTTKAIQSYKNNEFVSEIKDVICEIAEIFFERDNKLSKIKEMDNKVLAISNGIKNESVSNHSISFQSVSENGTIKEIEEEYYVKAKIKADLYLFPTGLLYSGANYV